MLHLFINLERSLARRQLLEKELSKLSIQFERIPAIDGNKLCMEYIKSLKPNILSTKKLWFPYSLIKTEYACFLSHRNCWQRLVDSNEDFALILEDDIKFTPGAGPYIANSDWIPQNIHLVQLCAPFASPQVLQVKNNTISIQNNKGLLYEVVSPTAIGAIAYIISREAAEESIKLTTKISAPVDEFLFSPKSPLRKKYPVFKINPGIGYQNGLTSTISTSPRNGSKPLVARIHPYSIMLKLKILFLQIINPKKIRFRSQYKD